MTRYYVIKGFSTYLDENEDNVIKVYPGKVLKLGYSLIEFYNMLRECDFERCFIDRC